MRLDVAVVGFVVFTILAPLGGGYLAAWLIDSTDSRAIVALLAGGSDLPALAAAAGGALALGLTLRFMAGSMLDAFVGAWPENQPFLADPRWRLMNLNSRFARGQGAEIEDDGPLSLGGAVGWVGSAVGALLFAGTSFAAWPPVDPAQIARIAAGTAGATDWVAAAFPVVARVLLASILGILAGAVWSTFGGPVARMEELEAEVEKDLDERAVVDAPAPDAGPR